MNAFPNRAARRAMRTHAREVAELSAANAFDYTPAGHLVRVSNPRAVAVLRRVFNLMLQTGKPVTLQISDGEAAAFPRWRGAGVGSVHVVAAWLDVEGRCSYSLRSGLARNQETGLIDRGLSAELAETLARQSLAELCSCRGFPMGQPEGRA